MGKLKTYSAIFGTFVKFFPKPILNRMEKYVFYENPDSLPEETADIAFVFGAEQDHWRVEKAVELYKASRVKKILISGGVSPYNQGEAPEADYLSSLALSLGVKEQDLFTERRASSSEENVEFSLRLLRAMKYDIDKMSFVAISSDFHLKRCVALLKKYLRKEVPYHAAAEHPTATREKWRDSAVGRFLILKEVFRLRNIKKSAI